MEFDISSIGIFGVNLSSGLDQTWATLWRKDDHFLVEFFAMVGDEDPAQENIEVSIEDGEAAIAEALEKAGIADWPEQFDASCAETIPGLVWTLDIDDLNEEDIAFYSGNEGLPSRAQFDALMDAMRRVAPDFGKGMECLEA